MKNSYPPEVLQELEKLKDCHICPRKCHANRWEGSHGYCRLNADFTISSITLHRGEEPVLVGTHGVCNIFFAHCNLQCIYCQNYQISDNATPVTEKYRAWSLEEIVDTVTNILDTGVKAVGFVSPSHCIPHVKIIIRALRQTGRTFVTIYNTNGYDSVNTLQELEEYCDVYLPDFKYITSEIAQQYSQASNYPDIAKKAICEMYRQKGSYLSVGEDGYVDSGLIIRHLVLPGMVEESQKILEYIAETLSNSIHISLMAQYYPTYKAQDDPIISRTLSQEEYHKVVDTLHSLGFYRGWVQDLQSKGSYQPDFHKQKPFEAE